MDRKRPRSFGELIGTDSSLARLQQEARGRLELASQLRQALPDELRPALAGCNLRPDGTLVLIAPSPAWAARLRFEGEALLGHCRERFPAAARVRIRVQATGTGSV